MRKWLALLFLACAPAWGAQYARPSTDETANCTGSYTDIDEVTSNTADYESCANQSCSDSCYCEVSYSESWNLSTVTDPAVNTGHVLRWRCNWSGSYLNDWYVGIYNGLTYRLAKKLDCTGSDQSYTLSGTEADSLTSYSNLRAAVTVSAVGDDGGVCGGVYAETGQLTMYWLELEVPDAGGGATRRIFIIE